MSGLQAETRTDDSFPAIVASRTARIDACLERALPSLAIEPTRLHEAMRYAVLSGGKRIRPLLVYAAGECLGVEPDCLDVPATAIELIHAFSLVHDDLPAMDDDDLRRGRPTVHRRFDEATAILAADALQPLAFEVIASSGVLDDAEKAALVALIANACGSQGMTGGQAIDLASHGRKLSVAELEKMHSQKTGALLHACIMSACCLAPDLGKSGIAAMDHFARKIGLAFQIRDDILDVEGETEVIGKPAGSDQALDKATWPALFGLDESKRHCEALLAAAMDDLDPFGADAVPLRRIARYIVERRL
jgi:farnesyl diphosphate synthase